MKLKKINKKKVVLNKIESKNVEKGRSKLKCKQSRNKPKGKA
jgi:hypothetical protein